MERLERWMQWCRKEAVLCAAFACALVSMLFVPPDAEYRGYVNLQVLCLLFCLMAVVLGLQSCGLFELLAQKLLTGRKSGRRLVLLLVLLPFFTSMLVTNDVALITFVPFGLLVLEAADAKALAIPVVVLQTVAANLGSMATPVGNPQNLYLYAFYGLNGAQFFRALLPLVLVSLLGLTAACLCTGKRELRVDFPRPVSLRSPGRLAVYLALFGFCLLSVFRLVPYAAVTAGVLAVFLVLDRKLLQRVDYGLLLTFLCFFVFSGNLGRIAPVRDFLSELLTRGSLLCSVAASQIISNVPAAVLLSGFTDDWRGLLAGVNIGGLGTPIASLASLISFRLYLRQPEARLGRYLLIFTLANLVGLAVLLPIALLL